MRILASVGVAALMAVSCSDQSQESNSRDDAAGGERATPTPADTGSSEESGTPTREPAAPTDGPPSQAPTPEPGEAVLSVTTDGLTILDASTDMIAMMAGVDGVPGIRTYDLAGNLIGENLDFDSLDPRCKFAIVRRSDDVNMILTAQTTDIPAEGVEPAQQRMTLWAADATTFEPLWSTEIAMAEMGEIPNCSPGATTGNDLTSSIWFTSDGRWAVTTLSTWEPYVIDLETGERHLLSSDAGGDSVSVAGRHALVNTSRAGEGEVSILDPETTDQIASTDVPSVLESELHPLNDDLMVATSDRSIQEGSGITQVLSLPGLESLWQEETLGEATAILTDTDTLLLKGEYLLAVEPRSGERLWERDEQLTLCAAAAGVVMVSVNEQIAYLDAESGEQISYDSDRSECPTMLTDTYGYESSGGTWTVYRLL